MNEFPTIEKFLENAFEYEELDDLMRYIKEVGNGCRKKPLNIYGQSNCGKTVLARLLKKIFKDDAVIMDSFWILSGFNYRWADKKLVIIDERLITDDRVINKIIKTYHSDYIHVETPQKPPREVFNNITFIIFTEHPLKENDNIVPMRMRMPIFYDRMVEELPEFSEFVKYYSEDVK